MSEVFELEEYQSTRDIDIPKSEVKIKFTNADLSWGYKIKE